MGCGAVAGRVLRSCRLRISTKSVLLHCQIGKCMQLGVYCFLDGTGTKLRIASRHYLVHSAVAVEVWVPSYTIGCLLWVFMTLQQEDVLFWIETSLTKCFLSVLRPPCHSLFPWNKTFFFPFFITEKCLNSDLASRLLLSLSLSLVSKYFLLKFITVTSDSGLSSSFHLIWLLRLRSLALFVLSSRVLAASDCLLCSVFLRTKS